MPIVTKSLAYEGNLRTGRMRRSFRKVYGEILRARLEARTIRMTRWWYLCGLVIHASVRLRKSLTPERGELQVRKLPADGVVVFLVLLVEPRFQGREVIG